MKRLMGNLCICVTFATVCSMNTPVWAQTHGTHQVESCETLFKTTPLSTVAAIQKRAKDQEIVRLQGRLTDYISKSSYEFTDKKGDIIEVELENTADWGRVHRDQLIEIIGSIKRNLFVVKVEAQCFNILEQSSSDETIHTDPDEMPSTSFEDARDEEEDAVPFIEASITIDVDGERALVFPHEPQRSTTAYFFE